MTRIEQAREQKITRRQVVKIEQKRLTLDQARGTNERLNRPNPHDYPRSIGNPIDTATRKHRNRKPTNKLSSKKPREHKK